MYHTNEIEDYEDKNFDLALLMFVLTTNTLITLVSVKKMTIRHLGKC